MAGNALLMLQQGSFLGLEPPALPRCSARPLSRFSSFLARAMCDTITCPQGMELKNAAYGTRCRGLTCTWDDINTCCEEPPKERDKKMLKSTGLSGQQDAGDLDQEALGGFPFTDKFAQYGLDPEDPQSLPKIRALRSLRPCDSLGRISRSRDGFFCDGADSCVTIMPYDFMVHVPHGAPLPPDIVGRPWCVPPEDVQAYGGPIEIRCNASGPNAQTQKGHPSGCWWVRQVAKEGDPLARLPGPIVGRPIPPPGQTHQDFGVSGGLGLTDAEAKRWVHDGELSKE